MEPEPRWGRGWVSLGLWIGLEASLFGGLILGAVMLPATLAGSAIALALGPHLVGLLWLLGTERGRLLDAVRPTGRSLLWGIGGAVGMILVGGAWSWLLETVGAAPPDMAGYLRDLVPSSSVLVLWGAVLVPFVEEGWFRGRFLEAVRSRLDVRWGFVLTSVVFTLVHGIPVLFPAYFTLAAILFVLRERTGGLAAPILAHAINNLWGLVVS